MNLETIASDQEAQEFWQKLKESNSELYKKLLLNIPDLEYLVTSTYDDGRFFHDYYESFTSQAEAEKTAKYKATSDSNSARIRVCLPEEFETGFEYHWREGKLYYWKNEEKIEIQKD